MDPTTIVFTLWIGSFNLRGTDVFIGKACVSNENCKSIHLVKPTFDAEFEVIVEPTEPATSLS